MKQIKIFVLAAIAMLGFSMCSQNKPAETVEEAVDSCAVMPEYPGGMEGVIAFCTENLKYPVQAEEVGMEGRVLVSFVIEKDGSVADVTVEESADSLLDAEAVRVISAMDNWTPGQNEAGEAVRVRMVVPVNFMLDGSRDDVDQLPEFPGGLEAYVKFMQDNLNYPKECEEKGEEGRVLVEVLIDKEGNVTNVELKKSVNELLDAEALRVVKSMPKWTPGQDGGEAVDVKYVIPVTFRLQ
ncbi:energy transducer TonB [Prevotella sp. E2-28]|uniref:energy transducer TonB n=1 Tax=Prevotella sp. E2-28 TaxID=2913620 RepID=UPI001EDA13CE|nr:energy transducer TonB [Prevotella sp. E2-28]UKK53251.1 energy transducer TonB [Prevotella sp. E2-28]